MKNRPDIIYGVCPVCGEDGGDYPASDLTDADAQDNLETTGDGVLLEWYQGELMCNMCIKRQQQDAESELAADKHAEAQKFRDESGFRRSIPS